MKSHDLSTLRLEIETDPAGLVNLVKNPSGPGAHWWVLGGDQAIITSENVGGIDRLRVNSPAGGGNTQLQSPVLTVPAGHTHIGGRFDLGAITAGHKLRLTWSFRDASGASTGSSPVTDITGSTTAGVKNLPVVAIPAGTKYAFIFGLYLSTTGNVNPTTTASWTFREFMLATATTAAALTAPAYVAHRHWLNILSSAYEIKINRQELDLGTLNVGIEDLALDPSSSSTIRPGRKIRLTTLVAGVWQQVYEGTVRDAAVSYHQDAKHAGGTPLADITLEATDNAAILAQSKPGVLYQGSPAAISRVAQILGPMLGSPPWNVNGSGSEITGNVVDYTNTDASRLDRVAIARDTSLGYAWVDRFDVLNAWDSAQMPSTPAATFSDAAGASRSYTDIDVDYDTETAINSVTIKVLRYRPKKGTTEEIVYGPYENVESIAQWGLRPGEFTYAAGQGIPSNAAIEAYANQILNSISVPQRRAKAIVTPARTEAERGTVATVDLYTLVRVQWAAVLDALLRVTSIEHVIDPDRWVTTYGFIRSSAVASPSTPPPPALKPPSGFSGTQGGTANTGAFTAINTAKSVVVTFPEAFVDVPVVTLTPVNNNPAPPSLTIEQGSISAAGFTARAERSSGTAGFDFTWIATSVD